MAKEQVKKLEAKRNNYQNVPENVGREAGRFAWVNGTKAAINRYSRIYPKYGLKRTSVNT